MISEIYVMFYYHLLPLLCMSAVLALLQAGYGYHCSTMNNHNHVTLPWANLLHQQPVVCVCRDPLAKPKAPQWIDPIGLTHTKGVSFASAFPLCRPGTPWFDLFGYTLTKTICRLQILLCFDSWVEWLAQAAIRTKGRHSYLPSVYEEPQARLGLRL